MKKTFDYLIIIAATIFALLGDAIYNAIFNF
jgi:hypothetical protein